MEVFDACFVEGMRSQEPGRATPSLLVVGSKSLPKGDRVRGIVAGVSHIEQTNVIGLAFLAAGMGERVTELGAEPVNLCGGGLDFRIIAGHGRSQDGSASLEEDRLRHPLPSVTGNRMGDFMTNHRGEPAVVFGNWKDARVDADLAARKAECVGFRAVEEDEFPFGIFKGSHRCDSLTYPLQLVVECLVFANRHFLLHLLEAGEAHLHLFSFGEQNELPATCLRHGAARTK